MFPELWCLTWSPIQVEREQSKISEPEHFEGQSKTRNPHKTPNTRSTIEDQNPEAVYGKVSKGKTLLNGKAKGETRAKPSQYEPKP